MAQEKAPGIDMDRELQLLEDLRNPAQQLIDDHLKNAERMRWVPADYVPWNIGRDYREQPWESTDYPLDDALRSAYRVNLLTEDNLPYYTHLLLTHSPEDHPMREWTGIWTAEEDNHKLVMNMWANATRALNPHELVLDHQAQLRSGEAPKLPTFSSLIAYTSLQELATAVAHKGVADRLDPERLGPEMLKKIITDEARHYRVYSGLARAAFQADPSLMMTSFARELRTFAMPGKEGIPGFERDEQIIAAAGIFNASHMRHDVLEPVLTKLKIDDVEGLDAEGERARAAIHRRARAMDRAAAV